MKKLKAEADLNADEIKEIGKIKWGERFQNSGENPDTIMIEARENEDEDGSDTAQFMLIVQDKYVKVDDAQVEYLKETFGEDVVSEQDVYEFNAEMIESYGEIISELIENCDKIPEKDKDKIIKAVSTKTVAKGTVDKFAALAKQKGMTVNEVINIFKPVTMAKNISYIPATPVY